MINYLELKKLGLSDKEAKIYLTSLQRGPETGPTLARLAEIVRPTAYVVYESLINKGLMSSIGKSKKTFYIAQTPDHLLSLIRLQRKEIEEKEREIAKIIPELELLANITGEKPRVQVFEGKEGLKAVIAGILKSKTKVIYSFIPVDNLDKLFSPQEHQELMALPRIQKKIKAKIIYTSKTGPFFKPKDPKNLREAIYVDEKVFPFKCGIDVYDNNIAFYSYKGAIMGVVIENEDMAATLKTIFEMIWQNLEKSKK